VTGQDVANEHPSSLMALGLLDLYFLETTPLPTANMIRAPEQQRQGLAEAFPLSF
jgi:hypothetical protein